MLSLNNVSKSYGKTQVLNQISFNIQPGEIVGLVGANGAGKTTLIKAILGLHHVEQGQISFDGRTDYQESPELMNQIGYLLDIELFDYLTAAEHLKLMGYYEGREISTDEMNHILNRVALKNDKKPIKSYSYGMKQRLRLALAIARQRKLLILDEPLLGLDIRAIQDFKAYLKDLASSGVSILLSSHQLSEIEDMIDRYLILESGQISQEVQGGANYFNLELETTSETMAALLKVFDEKGLLTDVEVKASTIQVKSKEQLNKILKEIYQQDIDVNIEQVNVVNQLFLG